MIRRYGPGKFNTKIDSYVYDLSTQGFDDWSEGDVSEDGVNCTGISLGPEALEEVEKAAAEAKDTLTQEERDLIRDSYGAILSENEQGFVAVDYYDTEKEYEKDHEEIADDLGSEEEGDEEVDEEEEDDEEEGEGAEDAEGEEAEADQP